MKTRPLGRTGVQISQVAMGTMAFGGDADEAVSRALFRRALEAGITLFDGADVYAAGRSESLLGEFIAETGCRDKIVLATKAYFPSGPGPNDRGGSRYHLVRAVEASLRRLQTDRIDLFYLHRYDNTASLQETLRAVDHLVAQGKILYPAVSNFAAWQAMKALGIAQNSRLAPIVALQPMYNLVKRQAEVELLPMARAEGLAVIPYSPLGAGLLTGKYGTDRRPATGRLVQNAMYQTRYGLPHYLDVADRFVALARARGVHPVSLAIAWVSAHPAVTAPLLGARTLEQLEPALAAVNLDMPSALYQEIAALSPRPAPATDRNEESSAHNYSAVTRAASR